jgi:hypothetical protein
MRKEAEAMKDIEKVIRGLEQFITDFKPFCGNEADWQKIYDALALLKAQEPKPPIVKENSYGWKFYYCPSCGKEFYQNNKFSFCEKCGQAVKWE